MALEEIVPGPIKRSKSWLKSIFNKTRAVTWALASTAAILILPISLEMERQEYLEQMKRQEREIILGQ